MAQERSTSGWSSAALEAFDPYGLLEDNEQGAQLANVDGDDDGDDDDDEPYYMLSERGVSSPLASYDDDQILTAQEKWLGDHWSSLLDLDNTSIKPEDNFFDLGGTSVEALKLGAATNHQGQLLAVPDVFRNPTLSDMAKAIQDGNQRIKDYDQEIKAFSLLEDPGSIDTISKEIESQYHIGHDIIEDLYPCTPLQKGLMALSLLKPGVYLEQHVYTIPKTWETEAFRTALQATANAHPILRTRIVQTERCGWLQVLDRTAIEWVDAPNLETYLAMDSKKMMGFGDPLLRCALIEGTPVVYPQFVLTIHHAIEDGWSMNLLPRKITETYEGLCSTPKLGFNRFVKYIKEVNTNESKDYWLSELAGPNPITFPRLPSVTYKPLANGRVLHYLQLPESHQSSVTVSSKIRAAWSMIAARYIDSNDTIIGVTVSGRSVPITGITDMLGPTIATIPVRIRMEPNITVQEFLEIVQRQATEMIPHEQYGLESIKALNNDAYLACSFQNLLIIQPLQESMGTKDRDNALREVPMDFPNYLNYALTVECTLMPDDGLKVEVGFDKGVIDEQQVKRVVLQFEHVLCQIQLEGNAHKSLKDIELTSPADKEEIMRWNIENPVVQNDCVHHLIEGEVAVHPESPAICAWDGNMSYAKLDCLAGILARLLIKNGVGPEVFVPLCFEKSLWIVVAIFAVMKAGGAFVLLDPSQPLNRLKSIMSVVQASVIIASPQQVNRFSTVTEKVIVIDSSILESLSCNTRALNVDVKSSNALYVTFTSGTTGEPKASVTEHVSCASAFKAQIRAGYFSNTSRVLQFASYSFDTSVEEILATLMAGGCICIPAEKERLSDLPEAIKRMNVNLLELTASATTLLTPESVLPGLKVLRQGGEPMTTSLINCWGHHLQLENSYGPSECCVTATLRTMTPGTDPTNIGRGINCLLWIAEFADYTRLAPIGTVGELLIQGPNVARGYLNKDTEAATAFIQAPLLPNTFEGQSHRLYKTGDMARYNSDGTVSILGRKDAQVKLRGQRLELAEIEYQVSANDAVAQSVAVKAKTGPFQDELVTVIQFREGIGKLCDSQNGMHRIEVPGLSETISTIRRHLELHLPSYMVPSVWVAVNHLPMTMAGKCNREAVSEWLESTSSKARMEIQAATMPLDTSIIIADNEVTALTLSTKLAELISNGNEQIRTSLYGKDLFLSSTGINSISIVTLASFIRQTFNVSLGIEILTNSCLTVRQLANYVERSRAGDLQVKSVIEVDLAGELSKLQKSLLTEIESSQTRDSVSENSIETIFVTGATGYLGTHILRAALFHPQIKRVVAHARATTEEHGLDRVISSARKAGWWASRLLSKLEVWIGDLGAHHLGLTMPQWEELSGRSSEARRIDAIIHNGAAVNWYKDYNALKTINVTSTLNLLCATACSPSIQKFVFVSGGPHWDDTEEDEKDEDLIKQVKDSNGYCQTKIISELLTKSFSRTSQENQKRIRIIKPGYIIGTASEGISNIDDFLWRLVAGAVNIQGVIRENADSWVFLAPVDTVTDVILTSMLHEGDKNTVLTKVLDGLTVGELWSTIATHFNYKLHPLDDKEFSTRLLEDVEELKQKHPLWPVMHLMDQGHGKIGSNITLEQRETNLAKRGNTLAAVMSNVEYLIRIGFLPNAQGERVATSAESNFSRT